MGFQQASRRRTATVTPAASVVFGRIVAAHVADAILGADGRIDPALLDTVGRLGGENYVTTRDRFSLKRPDRK